MRAEKFAVIGGAHEHRVVTLGGGSRRHRGANPLERSVDGHMEAVVKVAVELMVL